MKVSNPIESKASANSSAGIARETHIEAGIGKAAQKPRAVSASLAPDVSAPDFTSFLSRNFNGDMGLFAQRLPCMDAKSCRQIREKYCRELDGAFAAQIIHAIGWQDPAKISYRGTFGTQGIGKQVSVVLGLENPEENSRKPGKMQVQLYLRHGSLERFLESLQSSGEDGQGKGFSGYISGLEGCQASVKNCIYTSLRQAFGAEIDSKYRQQFLSEIGWLDPAKIPSRGAGHSFGSKGKSIALLLGLEKSPLLCAFQSEMLKKVHGDFGSYVKTCHGTLENFLDALVAMPSAQRAGFISTLLKAYDGQLKTREFQKAMLSHYGLLDPMNCKPEHSKTAPEIWAAFDLLGVGRSVHGRKTLDKTYNVQKYVFSHYHRTFSNYISECHGGKAENFIGALFGGRSHYDRSHFVSMMRSSLGKGFDIGKYEAQIYAKVGWANPISIRFGSESGAEALGGTISALFGLGDLATNRRAQSLILGQLHGSFSNYLKNCYNSDFFAFSDDFAKLHQSAKHAFLLAIHTAFPGFMKNPAEAGFILSQFAPFDPLCLKPGVGRTGKSPAKADLSLLCYLSGAKTKSKILPGILLLSHYGSFEGYMGAHYGGDTAKFREGIEQLPPKKRSASLSILRYAFSKGKPEYGRLETPSAISFRGNFLRANTPRPPLAISHSEATAKLCFDPAFVASLHPDPEITRTIVVKKQSYFEYHYPRMAMKWAEMAEKEAESLGAAYEREIESAVLSRIGKQNGRHLALAAAKMCLLKTAECRREAFAQKQLPELVDALEGFCGPQFPHALAFFARIKSRESGDGIENRPGSKNTWAEIISNLGEYIELRRENMAHVMGAHGFEKKSGGNSGFFELHLEGTRAGGVRVIVPDNRFLTIAYVIGETQVPMADAHLHSWEAARMKGIESSLSGFRVDLCTFCGEIGERLNRHAYGDERGHGAEITETAIAVLRAVFEHAGESAPQIALGMGMEPNSIYRHLNLLRNKGLVDRKFHISEAGVKFLGENTPD